MKKYWVEFKSNWKNTPMAFWVHQAIDENIWYKSEKFDPPAPKPNEEGLYLFGFIEYNGFIFEFSSRAQLDEFIRVLSMKNLPSTIHLSREKQLGPNRHWLSRLPAKVKSYKFREGLIKYCQKIKDELFKEG